MRGNSRGFRALCGQIAQISEVIGTFPAGRGMKKDGEGRKLVFRDRGLR